MADEPSTTRRGLLRKTVTVGAATVTLPAFMDVSRAATDSGNVELETTATVPTNTNIEITVLEDTDGDGTADYQQTETVPDGTNTIEYSALSGSEAQGIVYWLELSLSTSDSSVTPSLDSAVLTLPSADQTPTPTPMPDQPKQSPFQIWDNFLVFVSFMCLTASAVAGLGSRSMAVGALAAYSVFAYIAVETGHTLLTNILYLTVVLIVVGMAFKLWRLEFGGDI